MLRALYKRNSLFWAAILTGAFAGEYMLDQGVEHFYAWNNRGVFYLVILKCAN